MDIADGEAEAGSGRATMKFASKGKTFFYQTGSFPLLNRIKNGNYYIIFADI